MLVFALSRTVSHAQVTVNYNAGPGEPNLVDNTGTALPDTATDGTGNTVEIGTFTGLTSAQIAANAGNLAFLGSHWDLFDSTYIQTLSQGGEFAATGTSSSSLFDNKEIDLWVFLTSDGKSPAADFHNVLQYGLFSSTVANNSGANTWAWVFPPQGSPPSDSPIITSTDVKNFPVIYWGGVTAGGASLQLEAITAVPEPSGLMLLGCGAILAGLVIRRKRQ